MGEDNSGDRSPTIWAKSENREKVNIRMNTASYIYQLPEPIKLTLSSASPSWVRTTRETDLPRYGQDLKIRRNSEHSVISWVSQDDIDLYSIIQFLGISIVGEDTSRDRSPTISAGSENREKM